MKNPSKISVLVVVFLTWTILFSCSTQHCDYTTMSPCKLVYLEKPYKTSCLYCDGKLYTVVAHLIVENLNNSEFEVVGNIPKDYRIYDTLHVMASYSYVPNYELWVDPLPNPNHLPVKLVEINCLEKN